ncbi:MAG: aminotransferase class IV [Acidobacteriaceae bacterium]|nr:aminotransferase class IV [Acidobacteriaceae bacterium]
MHPFLLHNGDIRHTTEAVLSPGQVGFLNGWGVFTTMRVSGGVLFAYERHYKRMQQDAERLRVPFDISALQLETQLLALVEANRAFDATLRVAVVRNRGGLFEAPNLTRDVDLVAFTADRANWGSGVKLSYVPHGRYAASPFAGAKVTSWAQNLTWYEEAHERGFDEVILLNEHGEISECTSANIFVIQEDSIWTPPIATSGCLPGVTRAVLLEEIQVPGLTIGERNLTPCEVENSDQVFITSTTRDLLPVLEIDHEPLAQCPHVLEPLTRAFVEYRAAYTTARGRRNKIFAA